MSIFDQITNELEAAYASFQAYPIEKDCWYIRSLTALNHCAKYLTESEAKERFHSIVNLHAVT